mmetsp:Transcript_17305/g.52109  ORF Transcript_17305/g.52109 Transcript_17305/m.52109 type:complete len:262 (+) Transcript_17305:380-1165(+)
MGVVQIDGHECYGASTQVPEGPDERSAPACRDSRLNPLGARAHKPAHVRHGPEVLIELHLLHAPRPAGHRDEGPAPVEVHVGEVGPAALVQDHVPLGAGRAPVESVVEEEVGHVPLVVPTEGVHAPADVAPPVGVGAHALRHEDFHVRVLVQHGAVGGSHASGVTMECRAGEDPGSLFDGLQWVLRVVPIVIVGQQLGLVPDQGFDFLPEGCGVARGQEHARIGRREERLVLQRQVVQRQAQLAERLLDLQEVPSVGLVGI